MVGTPASMAGHRVTTSQLSRQAGGGDRHGDATLGLDQIVSNGPVGTLTGRVLTPFRSYWEGITLTPRKPKSGAAARRCLSLE
jgi:hypothetical protein